MYRLMFDLSNRNARRAPIPGGSCAAITWERKATIIVTEASILWHQSTQLSRYMVALLWPNRHAPTLPAACCWELRQFLLPYFPLPTSPNSVFFVSSTKHSFVVLFFPSFQFFLFHDDAIVWEWKHLNFWGVLWNCWVNFLNSFPGRRRSFVGRKVLGGI